MTVATAAPFELVTPRLRLRDYVSSDVAAVHRFASDPEVVEHVPFGPNTLAETEAFIRRAMESARATPRRSYEVALVTKTSDEVIGGLRIGLSDTGRDASLGYILRRDLWGKGLVTEAASALVEFGFARLDVHRIWATCAVGNIGSRRVLEKLGMKREAHFREDRWLRGRWRDSYLYAVLGQELGDARSRPANVRRTLVVINGPVASGKDAVSTALAGLLERHDRRVAAIGLDELWQMLDHQVPRRHDFDDWLDARRAAALLTDEFYHADRDTVIVNGPFFTDQERRAYLDHIVTPVMPMFVTLRVSFEEAWRRAQGDPHRVLSKDREWLAERHAACEELMTPLLATDLVLETDGRTPDEIALGVVERMTSGSEGRPAR